jgi:hypothetical protein
METPQTSGNAMNGVSASRRITLGRKSQRGAWLPLPRCFRAGFEPRSSVTFRSVFSGRYRSISPAFKHFHQRVTAQIRHDAFWRAETRRRYALARPLACVTISEESGRDVGLAKSGFRPVIMGLTNPSIAAPITRALAIPARSKQHLPGQMQNSGYSHRREDSCDWRCRLHRQCLC